MLSSACRLKVQSWLTRLLPLPLSRLAHPNEPGPEPVAVLPASPKSPPAATSAATSFSASSPLIISFAEVTELSERNGICFCIVCPLEFVVFKIAGFKSPLAARLATPSLAPTGSADVLRAAAATATRPKYVIVLRIRNCSLPRPRCGRCPFMQGQSATRLPLEDGSRNLPGQGYWLIPSQTRFATVKRCKERLSHSELCHYGCQGSEGSRWVRERGGPAAPLHFGS